MKRNSAILFKIPSGILEMLRRHSLSEAPAEACALIFGKITESRESDPENLLITYTATEIEPMPNTAESPVFFFMGDEELLYKKWSEAQKKGLKLVSVFHSHPAGSTPSSADRLYMRNMAAVYPGILWMIYDRRRDKFGVYIYDTTKNKIRKVETEIL